MSHLPPFSSQPVYLGSGVTPLIFVEVTPLIGMNLDDHVSASAVPLLSCPRVKLLLCQKTAIGAIPFISHGAESDKPAGKDSSSQLIRGSLSVSTVKNSGDMQWVTLPNEDRAVPVSFLPSEDPCCVEALPCSIVGYAVRTYARGALQSTDARITDCTLVRVLPALLANFCSPEESSSSLPTLSNIMSPPAHHWKTVVTSESCQVPLPPELVQEVLCNHNKETIRALTLRMSLLLKRPVAIGTTADALDRRRQRRKRTLAMASALESYVQTTDSDKTLCETPLKVRPGAKDAGNTAIPTLLHEGALILHSPNHGDGKTLLVQAIAQGKLQCDSVHIIQPGALLAQYGIYMDAALESLLHSIVMSAACRGHSVCIILDHLDDMLPPVGRTNAGDAAIPVLNAVAYYLKSLTLTLKRDSEFLFPAKNPLYNLAGSGGLVVETNACLIGIITCEDDGGRGRSDGSSNLSVGPLDMLVAGRYRLPTLSSRTRLVAFQRAFQHEQVALDTEAASRLPVLAASAVSARGGAFSDVARRLAYNTEGKREATLQELKSAMQIMQKGSPCLSKAEFVSNSEYDNAYDEDLFASVGGNIEGKQAIEEALALDPEKRQVLKKFGLPPPTGVLLYGPPGTGKTLLAKAVSRLLKTTHVGDLTSVGGSFISLQASEIVRSEVGNSEKILVSAFETARSNAPSVVFIDEFQALFTERSGSGSGKLASTLLQCMDDVCRWREADSEANSSHSLEQEGVEESSRVVVIGATNTPWMVDRAFLRSGRFDRVVHVGLPTMEERVSILHVHVDRMNLASTESSYADTICRNLAEKGSGFTGADLAAICRAAAVMCLAENGENGKVEARHYEDALGGFTPSCSSSMVQRLANWRP